MREIKDTVRTTDTVGTTDVAADTTKLKVGYVYKDKRGIDVLIVEIRSSTGEEEDQPSHYAMFLGYVSRSSSRSPSPSSQFLVTGIAFGNCLGMCTYTTGGKYSVESDDYWARDLLVETGNPWEPTQ